LEESKSDAAPILKELLIVIDTEDDDFPLFLYRNPPSSQRREKTESKPHQNEKEN